MNNQDLDDVFTRATKKADQRLVDIKKRWTQPDTEIAVGMLWNQTKDQVSQDPDVKQRMEQLYGASI